MNAPHRTGGKPPSSAAAIRNPNGLDQPHVAASAEPGGLARNHEPEINLAILPRTPPAAVLRGATDFGQRQQGRSLACAVPLRDDDDSARRQLLAELYAETSVAERSPVARGLRAFFTDVAEPAVLFRQVARRFPDAGRDGSVRLRLDRVDDGMCRAFHTDCYRMRMICTYHGAGTEWTPNANVKRAEMYSLPPEDRLHDAELRYQLQTGWLAILKGEHFHEGAHRSEGAMGNEAIVHRSPTAVPGQWRLILRVDCD